MSEEPSPNVIEQVARHLFTMFNQQRVDWDGMTAGGRGAWRLRAKHVLQTAHVEYDAPFRALAGEYDRNAQLMKVSIGDDLIPRWQAFEDAAASIRRALNNPPTTQEPTE
jgi:hypothetical protein